MKSYIPLILMALLPALAESGSTFGGGREFISCEFINRDTGGYLGSVHDWLRGTSDEYDLTPVALMGLGVVITHAGDVESVDLRVKNTEDLSNVLYEVKNENFRIGNTFSFQLPKPAAVSNVQAFCITYER